MKITLSSVYKTDKDKLGNPLMSKQGKPYTRMSIKANEYGDKWISGFMSKGNMGWKQGDIVEVEIKENGQYLNFELPKGGISNETMDKILNMLTTINLDVKQLKESLLPKEKVMMGNTGMEYPDEDISPEDIPF